MKVGLFNSINSLQFKEFQLQNLLLKNDLTMIFIAETFNFSIRNQAMTLKLMIKKKTDIQKLIQL